MSSIKTLKYLTCTLVIMTTNVWAFQMNPISEGFDLPKGLNPIQTTWMEKISADVHERITKQAYLCAQAAQDVESACPKGQPSLTPIQEAQLKRLNWGVEWNDDPNNLIRTNLVSVWLYWLNDAHKRQKDITTKFALEYRSHYGDLQFLHAMASKDETAKQTQKNIIDWMQFAYEVATGHIKPSATLKQLQSNFPFTKHFYGAKESWTVRQLFTNVGDFKRMSANIEIDDSGIADIAAGALLHTLEDSFSKSHVTRLGCTDPDESQYAVTRWNNYSEQNTKCHQRADVPPDWLDNDEVVSQPVVRWSAELLRRIDAHQPWTPEVENFVTNKVFALAMKTSPAVCPLAN